MNEKARFLQSKGKLHDDSYYAKASLEELERGESNQIMIKYWLLDGMAKRGEISLDNPPSGFGIHFHRWSLKKYGLKAYVDYLKKGAISLENIPGRLKVLGVSDEEIQSALSEPERQKENQAVKTLRSKVCRIANRIDRSISRKEAFSTAWRIVKNGGLEIKVAGVSFYNRQEALRRLATYEPKNIHAFLVPEYEHQHDANAIAVQVMVQGGKGVYRIGYVPKEETAIVKAFLGTVPELKVLDGDIRGAKVSLAA
jgi:hypothetical protein